jgi:hypothetical protein
MGSLGDVVISGKGRSEEEANNQLLAIVGSLYAVTTKIVGPNGTQSV